MDVSFRDFPDDDGWVEFGDRAAGERVVHGGERAATLFSQVDDVLPGGLLKKPSEIEVVAGRKTGSDKNNANFAVAEEAQVRAGFDRHGPRDELVRDTGD